MFLFFVFVYIHGFYFNVLYDFHFFTFFSFFYFFIFLFYYSFILLFPFSFILPTFLKIIRKIRFHIFFVIHFTVLVSNDIKMLPLKIKHATSFLSTKIRYIYNSNDIKITKKMKKKKKKKKRKKKKKKKFLFTS